MKTKEAQDYLKSIRKKDFIIRNKLAEREQMYSMAFCITPQASGERVQSSGSKQKMANTIDKCVDMDREIDRLIDELIDLKKEIGAIIEELPMDEYDVLHKMYFQFMTFDEIAEAKDRSKSWATTTHGRALIKVQKVLESKV